MLSYEAKELTEVRSGRHSKQATESWIRRLGFNLTCHENLCDLILPEIKEFLEIR